jgi:hypothetical protein
MRHIFKPTLLSTNKAAQPQPNCTLFACCLPPTSILLVLIYTILPCSIVTPFTMEYSILEMR